MRPVNVSVMKGNMVLVDVALATSARQKWMWTAVVKMNMIVLN